MPVPDEMKAKIQDLRVRIVNGEEVSDDELSAALDAVIIRRLEAPPEKKTKAKAVKVDLSDLE